MLTPVSIRRFGVLRNRRDNTLVVRLERLPMCGRMRLPGTYLVHEPGRTLFNRSVHVRVGLGSARSARRHVAAGQAPCLGGAADRPPLYPVASFLRLPGRLHRAVDVRNLSSSQHGRDHGGYFLDGDSQGRRSNSIRASSLRVAQTKTVSSKSRCETQALGGQTAWGNRSSTPSGLSG